MCKEFKIGAQVLWEKTGDAVLTIEELGEKCARCLEVVTEGGPFFGLGQTPAISRSVFHLIPCSELKHAS